jgi:hypothetical protein
MYIQKATEDELRELIAGWKGRADLKEGVVEIPNSLGIDSLRQAGWNAGQINDMTIAYSSFHSTTLMLTGNANMTGVLVVIGDVVTPPAILITDASSFAEAVGVGTSTLSSVLSVTVGGTGPALTTASSTAVAVPWGIDSSENVSDVLLDNSITARLTEKEDITIKSILSVEEGVRSNNTYDHDKRRDHEAQRR